MDTSGKLLQYRKHDFVLAITVGSKSIYRHDQSGGDSDEPLKKYQPT
jgi:hypothetical protein